MDSVNDDRQRTAHTLRATWRGPNGWTVALVRQLVCAVVCLCSLAAAAGEPEPAEPTPGRVGRGQATGYGQPMSSVDMQAAMKADSGTLTFWFSPQDWDNRLSYAVNEPTETVPLVRGLYRSGDAGELTDLFQIGVYRMSETKGGTLWVREAVRPGTWYHVAMVWDHGKQQVLVNGKASDDWVFRRWFAPNAPADAMLARLELGHQSWMRGDARKLPGRFTTGTTTIDEIRVYSRALTPPELANDFRRSIPGATLEELKPVYCTFDLNQPLQQLTSSIEFLDTTRDRVRSTRLVMTDAAGAVRLDTRIESIENGKAYLKSTVDGDLYGTFSMALTWYDADGEVLGEQTMPLEHPAPAWYGSTVGLHPGEVLPGWIPIERQGAVLRLLEKEVEIDARGWPSRLTGGGGAVQTGPVRITLASGDTVLDLAAEGDAPTVLQEAADRVLMQGQATAGDWRLTTTTETAFDGLIIVKATLTGPADASVTTFQVDIPLAAGREPLVGFWAGDPWFRGACDYRALPTDDGVIFASNATGRKQPDGWQERVSFLPYLTISDSERGLCWMAENDQNWSQGWETPAQQIIRDGDRLILRLNLVHAGEPMSMESPREYTFCLQTTPVRPASMIDRDQARQFHFAMVDGFNGRLITAAVGSHQEFRLGPENGDWEAVAPRSAQSRSNAPGRKMLMYLDHTWQRAPDDAEEYQRDWRGWGGATAYTPAVRDCMAWYQNEYLRRGLVDGFYIDDCWIKPTKSHAPSYLRDGNREWGFDFLGFRASLMRLRWLFHDNDVKPRIAVHVTQTLYYPLFVFTDVLVDGEDRFPPWGLKRDFIDRWGTPRIRYSTATASGLPTVYMNAIGNKQDAPGPMANWAFREARSYVGLCAVSDVWPHSDTTHNLTRSLSEAGIGRSGSRFIGYWDPANPLRPAPDSSAVLASVSVLPDQLTVVLLNTGTSEHIAELEVDSPALQALLGGGEWVVTDADPFDPPTGKDVMEYREDAQALQPNDPNQTLATAGTTSTLEMLNDLQTDIEDAAEKAAGPYPDLTMHNATLADGILRVRMRARDYRLLIIRKAD